MANEQPAAQTSGHRCSGAGGDGSFSNPPAMPGYDPTAATKRRKRTPAGVCEICGRPPKPGGRALHRDHNHKTGDQRGLLCFTCNRFILGKYATEAKLRAAADYLKRYDG